MWSCSPPEHAKPLSDEREVCVHMRLAVDASCCLQVRCFKYYHTVERVECTGLPQFTCYQKKQTCTTGTDTSTHGVSDNYNGWYDVQRCGTCNEYCYWDGSTSGVESLVLFLNVACHSLPDIRSEKPSLSYCMPHVPACHRLPE